MNKREKETIYIIAGSILTISAIFIYYIIDPSEIIWMPKCIFKLMTGYDCPACGGQRAIHAFLHGDISEALHYNLFLIVSLPYFFGVLYTTISKSKVSTILYKYIQHKYTILGYATLFIIWWIARNYFGI